MTLIVGKSGPEVSQLHQYLLEAGEVIDTEELRKKLFGPSTMLAVVSFQSHHVDAKGRPLKQDGEVGPLTLAALKNPRAPVEKFIATGWRGEPSKARSNLVVVVQSAIDDIGVREDPKTPNDGPTLKKFKIAINDKTGLHEPWCAYGVSFWYSLAPRGSPFGIKASGLKLITWAKLNGRLLAPETLLEPGDIGIIMRNAINSHVELVVAHELRDQPLSFVGANVGNAVRGTVRPRHQFTHFIRPLA